MKQYEIKCCARPTTSIHGRDVMKDNGIRIGLIHASQAFIEAALQIAKKNNYHLLVEPYCIEAAIQAGKRMEAEGIDVIVSRRHTASILRNNLSIPVLAVPVTSFDTYQTIWKAAQKWKSILFPIYRGTSEKKIQMKEMINADIFYYEYESISQIEDAILWGKHQGCQGVVVGPVTKIYALKHGMECQEIAINIESVEFTLEEACWVALKRKKEKEQTALYRAIINMEDKYVIAVNQHGDINMISDMAKDLFVISGNHKKQQNIKNILSDREVLNSIENGQTLQYHVGRIGNKQFLIDYIPAEMENTAIGGIVSLQDTENVIKAENEIRRIMTKGFVAKYSINEFIYSDPEMVNLIKKVRTYAVHESTILIIGPTGTGKEILAHAIHKLSRRKTGPFVSINCASIPEQLLESELFGYEEGSFTGARHGGKAGLFELAHKGTIFLDEIGSMPLSLQARLLRVLQEKEVMRVGGDRLIPVDARVIAATNEDLKQSVLDGRFREDLFFRVNVLSLYIPPLRRRIRDIPPLVKSLLHKLSNKHNLPVIKIPDSCIERLSLLPWPGNVRELCNFMERLIITCEGKFSRDIFEEQFAELFEYGRMVSEHGEADATPIKPGGLGDPPGEADDILKVLRESKYNQTVAARRLGISRVTLWRKLKKLPRI